MSSVAMQVFLEIVVCTMLIVGLCLIPFLFIVTGGAILFAAPIIGSMYLLSYLKHYFKKAVKLRVKKI